MGCTDFVVKYVLFVVNFLFTIIGILCIAASVYLMITMKAIAATGADITTNFIEGIIIGSGILITAIFGCTGAVTEKPLLLNLFAVIVLILTMVKMVVIIKVHKTFVLLHECWFQYVIDDHQWNELFSMLEAVYRCCGATGVDSYEMLHIPLPVTCCPILGVPGIEDFDIEEFEEIYNIITNTNITCTIEEAYDKGCESAVTSLINLYPRIINDVCVIIICLELIIAVAAFYLAQHYRNEKENPNVKIRSRTKNY